MAIFLYPPDELDFTHNGLGQLMPTVCTVNEIENGMYEAELTHPLTAVFLSGEAEKWRRIVNDTILSIPVPVRTMPEIIDNNGKPEVVTTLEKWKVVAEKGATVRSKPAGKTALYTLAKDETWTATLRDGNWLKGRNANGRAGWADSTAMEYQKDIVTPSGTDGIEYAVPAAFASQQLFRVYRVAWKDQEVTVSARHISYDFGKNLLAECKFAFVDGYAALGALMANLYQPAGDFECFTDITAQPGIDSDEQTIDWTRINPIEALLDPDVGFCHLYDAQCVRDNYSVYLLRQAGMDRGFTIAYGKNMTGLTWDENKEEVVTRLIPIGQTEEGQPLMLPELYVDSPYIGDYPMPYLQTLDVSDARVGEEKEDGTKVTKSMAYDKMRAEARKQYENGADIPTVSLTINFVNLGDTQEFAQFKHLQQVFVHDIIHVKHARLGLTFAARVTKTTWDAILQRYTGIEISTKGVDLSSSRIASWQVPSGVEGGKIRSGSITSAQLAPGAASGAIAPIDGLPVGTWLPYSGATPPSAKWLFAEGQALSAAAYPAARAIFGANLPDVRGCTLVHMDAAQTEFATLHKAGGDKTHAHALSSRTVTVSSPTASVALPGTTGAGSSLQPYLTVRYIVKVLP